MSDTTLTQDERRTLRRVVVGFIVAVISVITIIAILCGAGSTTVNPGEVGVLVRFGEVKGGVRDPGLYMTVLSSVTRMSTRTQTYTMAAGTGGGEAALNGPVTVLSRDQLPVSMDVNVMFHLNGRRAIEVFRNFGPDYDDRIIHPQVRTNVRDAASEFAALDLIDRRGALQDRMNTLVREKLVETLTSRGVNRDAIIIDAILIRNIDLPRSLDDSIAAVQQQRMAAQTATQANVTATQEAARLLTETNGRTAAQVAIASAQARITQINADALASANRTIANSLTPAYLAYARIQAMQAVLQSNGTRTVFMPGLGTGTGGGTGLMLNLPQ